MRISNKYNNQEDKFMYKSYSEFISERMPAANMILILKKPLKTRYGIFSEGTRVIIRQDFEDKYEIMSAQRTGHFYLSDIMKDKISITDYCEKHFLDKLKETADEYFEPDSDRTNEYKAYLGKKRINIANIIIAIVCFVGLILTSIFGWYEKWDGFTPDSIHINGCIGYIICQLFIICIWCFVAILGIISCSISSAYDYASRHNAKVRELLECEPTKQ